MVTIFFIGRLSLFIYYFDNIQNSDSSYWLTFLYGLRMDTIVASALLIVPLVLLTLLPKILSSFVNIFLKYYFLIIFSFLIYIEIATFPFLAQYDVRPNYLFVEYLDYPQEVFSMIFADYKIELSIAFLFISTYIYRYLKNFRIDGLDKLFKIKYKARAIMLLPIIIILFIGIRSSFGHRPANISDAIYSSNRILNEITKNSLHSIVYAIYVNKKYDSGKIVQQYGKMNINEAIQRVETRLNIKSLDKKSPLLRDVKTNFKTNNSKNLVIFIQESLGYQFVKTVGGEDGITPNFNRLSKEGILFKDLYSNGTRSIRGIAGVVSGNFSIPGKGVIKRNKSQKDYFTISKLLNPIAYHTSFK
jgi:phosphoglycerol transferase MdoB-like AlkP superfamily enzyme